MDLIQGLGGAEEEAPAEEGAILEAIAAAETPEAVDQAVSDAGLDPNNLPPEVQQAVDQRKQALGAG